MHKWYLNRPKSVNKSWLFLSWNRLQPNLLQLPNDEINEENLSPENIDSVNHIENNKAGNYIENNEVENNIENNETENHIENNETENHIENNQTENHIENNQTGNNNNLITESQEPNEMGQKLDDKTNKKPKGGRIDNLKRLSVRKSFGRRIDNLKRLSVRKSFESLAEMLNKIIIVNLNKIC